ncbi:MAG: TRAP transporter small permease [Rhodoferax sp.]|nr:TRAP transporter small permease [Rhodoferax sp.]
MTVQTVSSPLQQIGQTSKVLGARLNQAVEWLCALLLGILVLDVGLGVFGRYVIELPVTWTEELARYLMIWAALLAVSSGVARREHVAVTALLDRLPPQTRRQVCLAIDALAFAFFAFLCYFGIGMTRQGADQYATIFDMTMWIPFAAVPVSSALVCVQLVLSGLRDFSVGSTPAPLVGEAS